MVTGRAATLTVPFDRLARQLPAWRFRQQSAGSRFLLRKLLSLHTRFDLLAVADAGLFAAHARQIGWWLEFAGNQVVLAYTPRSRYAGRINAGNWPWVLLRPGVRFGYADPNLDPEGYNALLAWKLTARREHRPRLYRRLRAAPGAVERPQSVALLALLEAGEIDYAWEYESVARQHGLDFVRLPAAVNLGSARLAAEYAQVSVAVAGRAPGETVRERGRPIRYAITIPATALDVPGALAFLRRLASPAGRALLAASDQTPLAHPCRGGAWARAPRAVRPWLRQWPACP
ncbi:MAG: extracellular solute-binding protein [Terriglobales bacterium]